MLAALALDKILQALTSVDKNHKNKVKNLKSLHVKVTRLCSVYGVQLRCQGRQSAVSCQNWFTSFFARYTEWFGSIFLLLRVLYVHIRHSEHILSEIFAHYYRHYHIISYHVHFKLVTAETLLMGMKMYSPTQLGKLLYIPNIPSFYAACYWLRN